MMMWITVRHEQYFILEKSCSCLREFNNPRVETLFFKNWLSPHVLFYDRKRSIGYLLGLGIFLYWEHVSSIGRLFLPVAAVCENWFDFPIQTNVVCTICIFLCVQPGDRLHVILWEGTTCSIIIRKVHEQIEPCNSITPPGWLDACYIFAVTPCVFTYAYVVVDV
jgi:hypothetical protein